MIEGVLPPLARWGRCQEGYGEDPYLQGELATQYIQGLQTVSEGGYVEAVVGGEGRGNGGGEGEEYCEREEDGGGEYMEEEVERLGRGRD